MVVLEDDTEQDCIRSALSLAGRVCFGSPRFVPAGVRTRLVEPPLVTFTRHYQSSAPQPFKPGGIGCSLSDGVLNIRVPEIILNKPRNRLLSHEA
jgi:hypothetical protein